MTVDSFEIDKFINHVALSSRPFTDGFNAAASQGTQHMRAGVSERRSGDSLSVSQDSSGPRIYLAWAWESGH